MSDFHQRGSMSTLPRLIARSLDDIERELSALAGATPVALILPCTLKDLQRPAMNNILAKLGYARYLSKIVVSINQATLTDLPEIEGILAKANDDRIVCLWNDNPLLLELLPEIGLSAASGKGFNLWSALGWLLERSDCQVAITHDSDILHYSRELPALLTLPLLEPTLGYRFIKGYYPRLSGKLGGQLFGRVTRLFVGPLLRALVRVEGHYPLLDFLDGFRYPLAGEFGGQLRDLAEFSFPTGWSLEMDLLCSVYRSLPPESVAQIDLGSNYEHKHQILIPGKTDEGLTRLAHEIHACLMQQLAREGVEISPAFTLALASAYDKSARDTIRRYRNVALLNRLEFHESEELTLVEAFAQVFELPLSPSTPLPAWAELRRNQSAWCAHFMQTLTRK